MIPLRPPKAPWTVAIQVISSNVVRLGWRGDNLTEFYEIERLEWPHPSTQMSPPPRAGAGVSSSSASKQAVSPQSGAQSATKTPVHDPARTAMWMRSPRAVKADQSRYDSGGFLYSTEDNPESQASTTAALRHGEVVKPYTYRVCAVNRAGRACSEVVKVASADAQQRQQLLRDQPVAPGKIGK